MADRIAAPTTARGRRTRETVLAAAREYVRVARGYADTTMSDISDAAGVSHGTVYTYFGNKESVLAAVVAELAHEVVVELRVPSMIPSDLAATGSRWRTAILGGVRTSRPAAGRRGARRHDRRALPHDSRRAYVQSSSSAPCAVCADCSGRAGRSRARSSDRRRSVVRNGRELCATPDPGRTHRCPTRSPSTTLNRLWAQAIGLTAPCERSATHEVHRPARRAAGDGPRRRRPRDQPAHRRVGVGGRVPGTRAVPQARGAGLLGLEYDPAYGGMGVDHSYTVVLGEELGGARPPACPWRSPCRPAWRRRACTGSARTT